MFDFSEILIALKQNKKVMRSGWNGKNMYVKCVTLTNYYDKDIVVDNPCLLLKTPNDKFNTWIPSITDLFATDWQVIE